MVRCGPKNGNHRGLYFKRDWTKCSKFANYSRFNNQHNWGNLYDHLMSTRNFTLTIKKMFMWAPKIMRQMDMGMMWLCQTSHTNCMLCIQLEVGAKRKVSEFGTSTLTNWKLTISSYKYWDKLSPDSHHLLKRNSEPSNRKSSAETAAISGWRALSTIMRITKSPVATGTIFCSLKLNLKKKRIVRRVSRQPLDIP